MTDAEFLNTIGIDSLEVNLDRDSMAVLMRKVISSTMDSFSAEGLEYLDPNSPCLFISNHRDIFLDAALLQLALYEHGLPATNILAGQNLMTHPLMIKVCRANQVFCIERGNGGKFAFYKSMLDTSQRIHDMIINKNESVWIAQRNGRTKNGIDQTDPAVLKMLALCGDGEWKEKISRLHIVPMSISYEWESCDYLKARELYLSAQGPYQKEPGEDIRSIMTGIKQWKGKVHLTISEPIKNTEISTPEALAQILDMRIGQGTYLWPNNYIASDILNNSQQYADLYTASQFHDFEAHLQQCESLYRTQLLHIYAGKLIQK